MKTIDDLNQRYGVKTVKLAVEGTTEEPWRLKADHRSPNFLTELRDILVV